MKKYSVLFWSFGAFIYYKASIDAVYTHDISIIAALTLSVILGIQIFFMGLTQPT